MKKIFIFLVSLLLLSSCFSTSDSNKEEKLNKKTWLEIYSTWAFSVAVPSAWEKFSKNDKIIPKPIFWDIVLASVSKEEKLWFYNNFVVISQKLWVDLDSLQYSIINNALSAKDYLDYEQIKQEDIKFLDWDKSKLYVFKARYNNKSPKAIFIQTWKVCWETWYFLTIWLNQSVWDTTKYEKIIKTFTCKNTKNSDNEKK